MRSTKPSLEQELARLKAIGSSRRTVFHMVRLREADERGSAEREVALQLRNSRRRRHGRIGWDRDIQAADRRKRARAADTFAICISDRMPSCMRAPPPEPADDDGRFGESLLRWRASALADDGTHAAGHEREIGDGEYDGAAADVAAANDGGIGHAGLRLLRFETLAVENAVIELKRVFRSNVGEPFLEAFFIEQLLDANARR